MTFVRLAFSKVVIDCDESYLNLTNTLFVVTIRQVFASHNNIYSVLNILTLPPISTFCAGNKRCHWFIRRSSL